MGKAETIFIAIVGVFSFVNLILYFLNFQSNVHAYFVHQGVLSVILNVDSLIGNIVFLTVIGVVIGLIPTTSVGHYMKWILSIVFFVMLLFSVTISFFTYNFTIGWGLVSNVANLFSNDLTDPTVAFNYLINFVGFIGLICGVLMVSEG